MEEKKVQSEIKSQSVDDGILMTSESSINSSDFTRPILFNDSEEGDSENELNEVSSDELDQSYQSVTLVYPQSMVLSEEETTYILLISDHEWIAAEEFSQENKKINLCVVDENGENILHKAADFLLNFTDESDVEDKKNIEALYRLVSQAKRSDLSIRLTNDRYESPLHWLAYYPENKFTVNFFEFLLETSMPEDLNTYDIWGKTPLLEAIESGNDQIALKLIAHPNTNINLFKIVPILRCNSPIPSGKSSLDAAILLRRDSLISAIKKHKNFNNERIYVNLTTDILRKIFYGFAAQANADTIKSLLKHYGAFVLQDIDTSTGWTMLHIACFSGNVDVIKFMLNKEEIDKLIFPNILNEQDFRRFVNYVSKTNTSALGRALMRTTAITKQIVKLFIECPYFNINQVGVFSYQALIHLVVKHSWLDILVNLANRDDVDFMVRDSSGNTPLRIACEQGDYETVNLMVCLVQENRKQVNPNETGTKMEIIKYMSRFVEEGWFGENVTVFHKDGVNLITVDDLMGVYWDHETLEVLIQYNKTIVELDINFNRQLQQMEEENLRHHLEYCADCVENWENMICIEHPDSINVGMFSEFYKYFEGESWIKNKQIEIEYRDIKLQVTKVSRYKREAEQTGFIRYEHLSIPKKFNPLNQDEEKNKHDEQQQGVLDLAKTVTYEPLLAVIDKGYNENPEEQEDYFKTFEAFLGFPNLNLGKVLGNQMENLLKGKHAAQVKKLLQEVNNPIHLSSRAPANQKASASSATELTKFSWTTYKTVNELSTLLPPPYLNRTNYIGLTQAILHPSYKKVCQHIRKLGYEVIHVPTASKEDNRVEIIKRKDGTVLKRLCLKENARWIDFEHEVGHIKQTLRLKDKIYPTVIEKGGSGDILTQAMDTFLELHNRLHEFNRLFYRRAPFNILQEHAIMLSTYLQDYNKLIKEGWNAQKYGGSEESQPFGKRNKAANALYKKHFTDLKNELERCQKHISLYDKKFHTQLGILLKSDNLYNFSQPEYQYIYHTEQEILIDIEFLNLDLQSGEFDPIREIEIDDMITQARNNKWGTALAELNKIFDLIKDYNYGADDSSLNDEINDGLLIAAVKQDNREEVLRCLENPARSRLIDEVDTEERGSALYWAAACGHVHFIAPLLKARADINKSNNDGETPLYLAAQNGYPAVITALLDAGADASVEVDWGTALQQAQAGKEVGHREGARLLGEHFEQYPSGVKSISIKDNSEELDGLNKDKEVNKKKKKKEQQDSPNSGDADFTVPLSFSEAASSLESNLRNTLLASLPPSPRLLPTSNLDIRITVAEITHIIKNKPDIKLENEQQEQEIIRKISDTLDKVKIENIKNVEKVVNEAFRKLKLGLQPKDVDTLKEEIISKLKSKVPSVKKQEEQMREARQVSQSQLSRQEFSLSGGIGDNADAFALGIGITLTPEEIQGIMEEVEIDVKNQEEVAANISHALSIANINQDNIKTEVNKVLKTLKVKFEPAKALQLKIGIIDRLLKKMRSVQTKSSQPKDSKGWDGSGGPSPGTSSGGSGGGAARDSSGSSKRDPEAGGGSVSSPDRSFSENSREKKQAGEELKTATEVSNQGADSFSSSSTLKRKGLSMQDNEDKRLFDYYSKQGISVGDAYDNGDCFFDSISQSLGGSPSCKELRELCASYIEEDAKQTEKWVRSEMEKDAKEGGSGYDECCKYIKYTASEIARAPTWGRSHIEGRMICEKLNKSLYWAEYIPHRVCQLFYTEGVPENPPKVDAGEVAIVIVNELGEFKAYFATEHGWIKDTVTSQLKSISTLEFDPSVQDISPESITPEGDCKYDYDVFGDYLKTAKEIIDSAKQADILDEHIVAVKYSPDRYVIKPGQVQKQVLEVDFQESAAIHLIVKENHFIPLLRTPGLKLQQRPDQTPSVTAQAFQQSSSSSSKSRTKLVSSPPVSQMPPIPLFVKPETSTVTSKTTSTIATLTAMSTASAQQTSSSSSTHLSDNVEQCQASASSKQIDTDVPAAGATLLYLQTIHANAGSQTSSAPPAEEKQPRVLRERQKPVFKTNNGSGL